MKISKKHNNKRKNADQNSQYARVVYCINKHNEGSNINGE